MVVVSTYMHENFYCDPANLLFHKPGLQAVTRSCDREAPKLKRFELMTFHSILLIMLT
jgi:hypothetical protein